MEKKTYTKIEDPVSRNDIITEEYSREDVLEWLQRYNEGMFSALAPLIDVDGRTLLTFTKKDMESFVNEPRVKISMVGLWYTLHPEKEKKTGNRRTINGRRSSRGSRGGVRHHQTTHSQNMKQHPNNNSDNLDVFFGGFSRFYRSVAIPTQQQLHKLKAE
eukprot:TRINITY_DN3544_c0_g1_i1.p1 TRINITY_DN3544_c0_g1~~TRINITY_DN3544_c0_g1_i1.p1  ORF type:complete len:160 (-),score=1.71 TRINITY_DN3544_c0_g1_i1:14-493(-)